jgi:hypothetical protein
MWLWPEPLHSLAKCCKYLHALNTFCYSQAAFLCRARKMRIGSQNPDCGLFFKDSHLQYKGQLLLVLIAFDCLVLPPSALYHITGGMPLPECAHTCM